MLARPYYRQASQLHYRGRPWYGRRGTEVCLSLRTAQTHGNKGAGCSQSVLGLNIEGWNWDGSTWWIIWVCIAYTYVDSLLKLYMNRNRMRWRTGIIACAHMYTLSLLRRDTSPSPARQAMNSHLQSVLTWSLPLQRSENGGS